MKDDQPRRRFLRQVIAILPASALTPMVLQGCAKSEGAGERIADASVNPDANAAMPAGASRAQAGALDYKPVYFTEAEWTFLHAAVDELIPFDATGAGAVQAGVPEYIDRQMETPYGHGKLWYMAGPFHSDVAPELGYQKALVPRDIYRHGIADVDAWCASQHGAHFAALPHERRVQVLEQLQTGKIHLDAVPAALFFRTLLGNTKEGYFADPMYGGNRGMAGWKMIGFPGARADYADWVEQPGAKYPLGPVSILGEKA